MHRFILKKNNGYVLVVFMNLEHSRSEYNQQKSENQIKKVELQITNILY